jgi:hypothetical protein
MTPARQSTRASGRLAVGMAALLLLAALFLPARAVGAASLAVDWRPSVALAGLLFLAALVGMVWPQALKGRGVALFCAMLTTVAAGFNLADAAAPSLLGRELNLYWDARHLRSLVGLAAGAEGSWQTVGVVAGLTAALGLIIALAYQAWRRVLAALANRHIAIVAALVLGLGLNVAAWTSSGGPLAPGLAQAAVRQAKDFARSRRAESVLPAALAAPAPPPSDFARLKRRDVYLVFIESYGTVVFDRPDFRAALEQPMARFASALDVAGYSIASNRLVSPTYGGGSWLAHATMASGVRLDDPTLYAALFRSGRKLLPAYFKQAGWRAIDIMPGIKGNYPEGRGWGFDREIFAANLGYAGPSFGWFQIPDQFTMERAGAIRSALGAGAPVFIQVVLVSSHIPFQPLPPYLADWSDAGTFAGVPRAQWPEIYRQPEWTHLAPAYLKSLEYDFAVLRDWLVDRLPGDALVILLGDHQPPAMVTGGDHPWTVPIHVLSRDPAVIAPFLAQGYFRGLDPKTAPPYPGMESFLGRFLAAFDGSG